jgi:hypothetical protein
MRNDESGDLAFLQSRLRRFRRRAVAALFLDAVPACLALSFALWIVWALLFALGRPPLMTFALGGFLAALLFAAMRRPSIAGTARWVDRKAGLEQRLETAAELMDRPGDDDIVAALILRDARRVTEGVRSDVVPLRIGTGRWARGAFAILTLVLIAALLPRRDGRTDAWRFSPVVSFSGPVPDDAVRMPDAQGAPAASGEAASDPDDEEDDQGAQSTTLPDLAEPTPRSWETAEPSRGPDAFEARENAGVLGRNEEEWTAIEAPLGRARAESGDPETRIAGAGSRADRGEGGSSGAGGETPESRDASLAGNIPPGKTTHYESPTPSGGVPPGLREYVREYFAKLRTAR